jgi:ethanolamine utilization protein EutN
MAQASKCATKKGKGNQMIIGTVVGSIVSTRKNERLVGQKLLIVRPFENMEEKGEFVAIDNVGAGFGETVLVARGSAARIGCNLKDAPVDAAIVGIVDEK